MTGPRPIGVDRFEPAPHVETAPDDGAAWMRYMRRGEFEAAWRLSDAELRRSPRADAFTRPRHQQRLWDGRPVDGRRVLVRCYHGLGDTLQFIRYARLLRSRAAEVIVWAQPALLPVLQGVAGVDRWLPLHDGDVGVDYDADIELMELPHIFRTALDAVPSDVPYLHVEPAALEASSRLRVGIVWRAGEWAPERTVPFGLASPRMTALPAMTAVLIRKYRRFIVAPEGKARARCCRAAGAEEPRAGMMPARRFCHSSKKREKGEPESSSRTRFAWPLSAACSAFSARFC